MTAYLAVAIGGALGSMARYWFGGVVLDRFGTALPWGTVAVNLIGSFLIGVLGTLAVETEIVSVPQRQFLLIGMLGGFTTFSTLSFEFQRYLQDGDARSAFAYLVLTLIGGFVAVFAGVLLARAVQ